MITPAWCQTMARYNAWQNANLIGAADGLDDADRKADRGAWFGSIHRTLNHILWGDLAWMARFTGAEVPKVSMPEGPDLCPDWADYTSRRLATDRRIIDWSDGLTQAELDTDLSWFSGVLRREVNKPRALLVSHMFNHQTHHRGQVHAMLTAAGVRPGDTDLFLLPVEAEEG